MGHELWNRALTEQNEGWLRLYFIAATGNHAEVEDLVQETFAQALAHSDRFDASRSLGAWLRGIARNVYLENRRKSMNLVVLSNDALDQLDVATETSETMYMIPDYAQLRVEALRNCLETLSKRTLEVFQQRYFKKQSSKMIATAMEISVAAVDLILSRGRKALLVCVNRKIKVSAHG